MHKKLYDLQGRFVGIFSNVFDLIQYDKGLFANAAKSRIPLGVTIGGISNGRRFVNERLVMKK
jgi:hypothetical protein